MWKIQWTTINSLLSFLMGLLSGWVHGIIASHGLCLGSACSSQAQDDFIEVQLNSVWVTDILGDPMYVPHKNCGDPVTGHCKRHAQQGCQTIREEEASILATVTLADHTGELDRVLVDGDRLQFLANVKSKAELLTLLMRRGPQAVCFRRPADVRLAYQLLRRGCFNRRKPSLPPRICRSASFRRWRVSRHCVASIRRPVVP